MPMLLLRTIGRASVRAATFAVAVVATTLSCSSDTTGPGGTRLSNNIAFLTEFPTAAQTGGSALVPFNRVRILLVRQDESTAIDTVVNYPATGELTLTLRVPLAADTPPEGLPLLMTLEYINAAGDVVFRAGPTIVYAVPFVPGAPPPEPVSLQVDYVGPGSNAASVAIVEQPFSVLAGAGFTFTAVAFDGQAQPIPGTPIAWRSLDPLVATITSPAAGTGTALSVRGSARVVAELLTGQADTVVVGVLLPPATITVVSGSGQSAGISQTLSQSLIVEVKASDGVPVPGVTVTFAVTGGGGSVGTPSAITDANGRAQTTWLLGALVGAQSVSATVAGIATPASFTATASSAGATQMQFAIGPSTVTAGIPISPAPVVVATDALGATVTSFTGPITLALGANPGGATLGGTLTVNAVGGVATFNNVRLNRTGAAYTLAASSPGLTGTTSAGFTVIAAPPIAFNIVSGNAQAGPPSTQLAQPLVVSVTDSLGNGVPGIGVTWGNVFGGGSLANQTTITNTSGQASATWTLGATGSQSVDVFVSSPIVAAVFFTATAVAPGVTKVWTGATDANWATASNWAPVGVPGASDAVQISAASFQPVLSSSVSITSLIVDPGVALDVGTSTLTLSGNLNADGGIMGSGSIVLNGTGTLQGLIAPTTQTIVEGNYQLSSVAVSGRFEVKGSLVFGGFLLSVIGPFLTADNGTITMDNAAAALSVDGNVFFEGGSETGLLTQGVISLTGNFTQSSGTSATSFVAGPSHTVILTGDVTQTVSFASPDTVTLSPVCAASCFGSFAIGKVAGAATFNSAASVRGDLSIVGGSSVAAIGSVGNPRVITVAGATVVGPDIPVQINRFRTTGDLSLDPSTVIDTIAFSGTSAQSVPAGATFGTVEFLGSPTLTGNLTVTGTLTVANGAASTAILTLNGFRVDVGGNLIVTNGGSVVMAGASDSLVVAGNAGFGGGPNSMTGGVLIVGGDFLQTGGASFAASGSHTTVLNGTGLQTVGFANFPVSFFRRLFIEKTAGSVNFATSVQVNGVLRASTSLTAASPFRVIADTLWGAIGSSVTPFVFELRRVMADSGAFSPDTVVYSGSLNTSINTTGPAGFGTYTYKSIRVDKLTATASFGTTPLTVQNDVVVNRGTLIMNGAKVTVLGNFRTESTGSLQMTNALDSLGVAGDVVFNGASTAASITGGVLTVGGNFQQSGNASSFAPTLTHRTKFIGSTPGVHTISFASPTTSFFRDLILDKPLGTGQVISLLSNVLVTDSMTVTNGTTLNSAANQRLTVQGRFHYEYIGGTNIPTVSPFALELTTLPPALDSILPGPPTAKFFPDTLVFLGTANYTLPFSNYTALRSVRVSTTGIVDIFLGAANDTLGGDLHISQGSFQLKPGNDVFLVRKLRTTNAGFLNMSGGQMTVRDSTIFGGATVNPFLTGGTIRAMGHFVQTNGVNDASFNADPPHTVEFAGTANQNIFFQSPGYTTLLSHFGILRITNPAGVTLQSDALTHELIDQNPNLQEKITSAGFKLTAEGVDVNDMLFDNTRFQLEGTRAVVRFDTVTFANYTGTPDILTVTRNTAIPAFFGLVFPTTGFNGRYVISNDLNTADGSNMQVMLNSVLPLAIPPAVIPPIARFACTAPAGIIWNGTRVTGGNGCN
jgi:hypothetical protein